MDSKAEAGRYIELLVDQARGKVMNVIPHPHWDLLAAQEDEDGDEVAVKIAKYTADFKYNLVDQEAGLYPLIVEDVKGQVPTKNATTGKWTRPRGWSEFQMRLRILKANYGIEVVVVPNTKNYLTKTYEQRHLFQSVLKGVEL
jgi:hypothetical protein